MFSQNYFTDNSEITIKIDGDSLRSSS